MVFDFDKELAKAQAQLRPNGLLGLLVLAPSGGGKSTLAGTLGEKTLYLYTRGENHGPKAASTQGGENIVPFCLDKDGDEVLNQSKTLKRLTEVLDSGDKIAEQGFKAIVLDSATELEAMIRGSATFSNLVGSNDFKKTDVMIDMMRAIILKLIDLQEKHGIHFIVTCPLDVQELSTNGEIIKSQPKLVGFRTAEALVQMFPDILVVGPMSNSEQVSHRIQFAAGVSKDQKDQSGGIKKTTNFKPRLTGVDLGKVLPDHGTLPADLKEIVKLKEGV